MDHLRRRSGGEARRDRYAEDGRHPLGRDCLCDMDPTGCPAHDPLYHDRRRRTEGMITFRGGVWIADLPFAAKDELKAAGFKFHGNITDCKRRNCRGCAANVLKMWWTDSAEVVRKMNSALLDSNAGWALRAHDDTVEASRAGDAELEVPAPPGLSYLPFQRAGIDYILNAPSPRRVLLGDEMGCVDGQAELQFNRAGRGFGMTIADAYKRFHGLDRYAWDRSIATCCKSLVDGELRQHGVVDILAKGTRPVVEVRLRSGKTLRVTPDHEIATESGWPEARSLIPGMGVLTNGQLACPDCGTSADLITYRYAKFRGYCRTCMYRHHRAKPTFKGGRSIDGDGYVNVSGQQDHPRQRGGRVYEHILVMEEHVGRHLVHPEQVHHRNGIKHDNRLENLELVSPSDHHRKHRKHRNMDGGVAGKGGLVRFIPVVDPVDSVTPVGECEVYDLVMADPHRNFVANGVVVHNCGKTVQAIGYMNLEEIATALVICPASLKVNWMRELERWLTQPRNIYIVDNSDPPPPDAEVVIVNYERAHRPEIHEALMGWWWELLIADEAHYLKSPKAKRTVAVLGRPGNKKKKQEPLEGLIHRTGAFLALTGTAMLNRPIELWTLVHTLDPEGFPDKHRFGVRYCAGHQIKIGWDRFGGDKGPDGKPTGAAKMAWDFKGASNLEELQDKLRGRCMVRRMKADVLPELPPKRHEIITLDPKGAKGPLKRQTELWLQKGPAQMHANLAMLLSGELDRKGWEAAVARLEADLEVAFEEMSAERKAVAVAKIPIVIDHIKNLLDNHDVPKLVVFCCHHVMMDALMEEFGDAVVHKESAKKNQAIAVNIDGRTPAKLRQAAVDEFQDNPEVKLMVAGIRAAGEGLTLTAASHEVFAELDWTPARNQQAEDRCHRIGQHNMVLIQHLVYDGSIDAMIAKLLVHKMRLADKVLNR